MTPQKVVVDTNILFSALLRNESQFTRLLLSYEYEFFICESAIVELFKHKERIVQLSKLDEEDIVRLFYVLLRSVTVFKEDLIPPEIRRQALAYCQSIDEADTPHVALAIHLDALLWTGDRKLKDGMQKLGFTDFFPL